MKHTIQLKEVPGTDDVAIELPDDIVEHLGLKEGDVLDWTVNDDGSIFLRKKVIDDNVLVMVECIQTFRTRYVVEAPKDHPEYALDTVAMQEAPEFSQEYLGETIVSHRIVSEQEALQTYLEDNPEFKNLDFATFPRG